MVACVTEALGIATPVVVAVHFIGDAPHVPCGSGHKPLG
jgi:hypothetical protein